MAFAGAITMTLIIRAAQLRPGDTFETLHTKAAGVRTKNGANAANYGVKVELWYPDRREARVSLHPAIRVRLMERAGEES